MVQEQSFMAWYFENSYNPERDTYFNLNFVYDESDKMDFTIKHLIDLKRQKIWNFTWREVLISLYTLDYLEAEASRNLSAEDKMSYFKKIMPIPSTGP